MLQQNKKKKVTATLLPLPSLLHCKKKRKGNGNVVAITFFALL
jgi:hypothetical protein